MGLMNLLLRANNAGIQKIMSKEAERLADIAAKVYPVVKAQNPGSSEEDILFLMLNQAIDVIPTHEAEARKDACGSIETLCYHIASSTGVMHDFDKFRLKQFTMHMDAALYARGFKRQSLETQARGLRGMGFSAEDIRALQQSGQ